MNGKMEQKNEIQELNVNELEQVNGGIVWFIPIAVGVLGGAYALYKGIKALTD